MPIANSVSVAAGERTVTGALTQFVAAPGDLFVAAGIAAVIEACPSTAQLTLKRPWPGPTLTGLADWDILKTAPYWSSSVTTNAKVTDLIARLEGGLPFKPDATGALAERGAYDNQAKGFAFLRIDVQPFVLFIKRSNAAGGWSAGAPLTGEKGDPGAGVELRVNSAGGALVLESRTIGTAAWSALANLDTLIGTYRTQAAASAQAAATSESNALSFANASGAAANGAAGFAQTASNAAGFTAADRAAVAADRAAVQTLKTAADADATAAHADRLAADADAQATAADRTAVRADAAAAHADRLAADADAAATAADRLAVGGLKADVAQLKSDTATYRDQGAASATAASGAQTTATTAATNAQAAASQAGQYAATLGLALFDWNAASGPNDDKYDWNS